MAPQRGIQFLDITIDKGQRVGKNGGGSSSREGRHSRLSCQAGKTRRSSYNKPTCRVDATLDIRYIDRDGSKTRRVIDVREIQVWDDSLAISAFCRLRKANRTFVTKRIVFCVDTETGEEIANVDRFLIVPIASPNYAL